MGIIDIKVYPGAGEEDIERAKDIIKKEYNGEGSAEVFGRGGFVVGPLSSIFKLRKSANRYEDREDLTNDD